jgi:hypothetical protein
MYSSFEIFLANFSFFLFYFNDCLLDSSIQFSNQNESTLAGFENGSFNILNLTFVAKKYLI